MNCTTGPLRLACMDLSRDASWHFSLTLVNRNFLQKLVITYISKLQVCGYITNSCSIAFAFRSQHIYHDSIEQSQKDEFCIKYKLFQLFQINWIRELTKHEKEEENMWMLREKLTYNRTQQRRKYSCMETIYSLTCYQVPLAFGSYAWSQEAFGWWCLDHCRQHLQKGIPSATFN